MADPDVSLDIDLSAQELIELIAAIEIGNEEIGSIATGEFAKRLREGLVGLEGKHFRFLNTAGDLNTVVGCGSVYGAIDVMTEDHAIVYISEVELVECSYCGGRDRR